MMTCITAATLPSPPVREACLGSFCSQIAGQSPASHNAHVWPPVSPPASTYLPHAAHDAELLRVDEALQHHANGHVDIILYHIVPQVDACMGLCHADHGLYVPHGNGDAACGLQRTAAVFSSRKARKVGSGTARSPTQKTHLTTLWQKCPKNHWWAHTPFLPKVWHISPPVCLHILLPPVFICIPQSITLVARCPCYCHVIVLHNPVKNK